MTVKEYLSQAYRIDQRINSKLEQVASLRALATKATSTLSDTPPSGSRNVQSMENVIVKIIDLENEINEDIDTLVDLKREIVGVIKRSTTRNTRRCWSSGICASTRGRRWPWRWNMTCAISTSSTGRLWSNVRPLSRLGNRQAIGRASALPFFRFF